MSITFVSIFLEALPFMLLGALIGGFIEVVVSKNLITRIIPAGKLPAILLSAGLGLVFPVCECAFVAGVLQTLVARGGLASLFGSRCTYPFWQ